MPRSIIEYFAENEKSKCGYCKKPDSNYSHGDLIICNSIANLFNYII